MSMSLSNKSPDQIQESDLLDLIKNQVAEGKVVDYKREAIGNSDNDKKEFLYDVSSFANASGGHLIIGMDEDKGLPTNLTGLDIKDIDAEKARLDSIILSGIAPRMVPSYQIQAVKLQSTRTAIVIAISKSLTMPHMVTYQKTNKFYSRNSHGKYLLDVGEIRSLFLLSESQLEKINRFRMERISKIIADETPVKLMAPARIVLHIVPLSISDPTAIYDLTDFPEKGQRYTPMVGDNTWNDRRNFDGYLVYSKWSREENIFGYVQFFRNGAVEAVDCEILRYNGSDKTFPSVAYEREIVKGIRKYLRALAYLKVQLPVLVMVSLLNVRGYNMAVDRSKYWGGGVPIKDGIDRDSLFLDPVKVENFNVDLPQLLKAVFDSIWMATGWKGSENYDENGKWIVNENG